MHESLENIAEKKCLLRKVCNILCTILEFCIAYNRQLLVPPLQHLEALHKGFKKYLKEHSNKKKINKVSSWIIKKHYVKKVKGISKMISTHFVLFT